MILFMSVWVIIGLYLRAFLQGSHFLLSKISGVKIVFFQFTSYLLALAGQRIIPETTNYFYLFNGCCPF